jgi:hypothetical protein
MPGRIVRFMSLTAINVLNFLLKLIISIIGPEHITWMVSWQSKQSREPGAGVKFRLTIDRERLNLKKGKDLREVNMIYDWEFHKRSQCSGEDKKKCATLAARIVGLSEKARSKGILALEGEVETGDSALLKKGLNLIVDGVDPEIVRKILEYTILSRGSTGKQLLSECLIMEGVLAIQAGYNPRILGEILCALLDDENAVSFTGRKAEEQYAVFIAGLQSAPPRAHPGKLESTLDKMDDKTIQKILGEIDTDILAAALLGIDEHGRYLIFKNCSVRAGILLKEDMELHSWVTEVEIRKARNTIESLIYKLLET